MTAVMNTKLSQYIPPAAIGKTAGTWTPSEVNNTVYEGRTAAAAAFTLLIPVPVPSGQNYREGAILKSIDVCSIRKMAASIIMLPQYQ